MTRVERRLDRLAEQEAQLHAELVEHADDYERLAAIDGRLRDLAADRSALEEEWLAAADVSEG
jgi:ATP-binding cassette subfamily F protein uup